MKENDDVNNPKHYDLFPGQQAIDVIQAALAAEEFAGYCKGNALKYRLRAGSKGDALECIAKANWYQNKLREAKRDSEEETGLQAELERERERRFEEKTGFQAKSAIAQYRKEHAKPLTNEELKAGMWWCADTSEECAEVLDARGLLVFNPSDWVCVDRWENCGMGDDGVVRISRFNFLGEKQIHRIGNEFYWSEK